MENSTQKTPLEHSVPRLTWVEAPEAPKADNNYTEDEQDGGDVQVQNAEVRSVLSRFARLHTYLRFRTIPETLESLPRRKVSPSLPRGSFLAHHLRFQLSTRRGRRKRLSSLDVVEDSKRAGGSISGRLRASLITREPFALRGNQKAALGRSQCGGKRRTDDGRSRGTLLC